MEPTEGTQEGLRLQGVCLRQQAAEIQALSQSIEAPHVQLSQLTNALLKPPPAPAAPPPPTVAPRSPAPDPWLPLNDTMETLEFVVPFCPPAPWFLSSSPQPTLLTEARWHNSSPFWRVGPVNGAPPCGTLTLSYYHEEGVRPLDLRSSRNPLCLQDSPGPMLHH